MTTEDDKQQVVTDLAVTAADRALRAAATTVGQMADAELQCKLSQLNRARAARTPREVLRQQSELDSLELDQMAYKLASQAHANGNLPEAARCYRVAATNDFADAALKLAMVLDSLAAKYLGGPENPTASREDLGLVTEAASWYLAAFLAGDLDAFEALDPLDSLIARLDGQARAALVIAAADDLRPAPCALGGLQNVAELQPAEAINHCRSCRPCKDELIKLNRLLRAVLQDQPSAETTDASAGPPDSTGRPQRPLSDFGSTLRPEPSRPG